MIRILVRLFADAALVALLLFASAGTAAWWRAWVLVSVLLVIRVATAVVVYRVHPGLLRERAKFPVHAAQPWTDRLLVLGVIATGFLGLPIVAGIDVFRGVFGDAFGWMPRPTATLSAVGLVMCAAGWVIKGLALRANAFATTVVRPQRERGQVLVDAGVYGIVRHPFYAADPLIFVGLSLWLQSYRALIFSVVPLALLVMRIRLEERFLRRELPEYDEYTRRVRHRLVPGVW